MIQSINSCLENSRTNVLLLNMKVLYPLSEKLFVYKNMEVRVISGSFLNLQLRSVLEEDSLK